MKLTYEQATALGGVATDGDRPNCPGTTLELLRGDHGKVVVVSGKREAGRPINERGAWVWYVEADGSWERVCD